MDALDGIIQSFSPEEKTEGYREENTEDSGRY